jgi:hypothetical protein
MNELIKLYFKKSFLNGGLLITSLILAFVFYMFRVKIDNPNFLNIIIPPLTLISAFFYINVIVETTFIEIREGLLEFLLTTPLNFKKLIITKIIIMALTSYIATVILNLIFFIDLIPFKNFFYFNLIFVLPFFCYAFATFSILLIIPFIKKDIRVKNVVFIFLSYAIIYSIVFISKMMIKYKIKIEFFQYSIVGLVIIFFIISLFSLRFYKKYFLLR